MQFNRPETKLKGLSTVLHIDLMCNAGPYWSRKIASISESYAFADSSSIESVRRGLLIKPTHIVLGGGFWNSEISKKPHILIKYLQENTNCVAWSYWGDGTKSLMKDPFPNVKEKLIDAIFCSSSDAVKAFTEAGYFATYAVHPVETEIFYRDDSIEKIYDWSFVGTNYGQTRQRILDKLKNLNYSYKIYGPGHNPRVPSLTFEKTASLMRQSKISININDDLYTDLIRYFSDRIPMSMCCNSMVLTTYQPGIESIFERGKNIDWFSSDDELIEKLEYYINNDEKRSLISSNACSMASENFSIDKMINNFFTITNKRKRYKKIQMVRARQSTRQPTEKRYSKEVAKRYSQNDGYVSEEYLQELSKSKDNYSVLDMGCGTGRYIPYVRACNLDAVDISVEMLEFAKLKKTKNGICPSTYKDNIQNFIKTRDCAYDFIYSIGLFGYPQLESIYNDVNEVMMNNIRKSLKDGGVFFGSFSTIGCNKEFVESISANVFSKIKIWEQEMKEVGGYKPPNNIFLIGQK